MMKPLTILSGMIMTLALPMTAKAENISDVSVNDTSRVVDLDEVIVVAQPKEVARLRVQPVSSSVFDTKEMDRVGVKDLRQLSDYVPSFAMPQYGSRLTSAMYMRGLGSRISNTAVGIYYDNIPLLSPGMFNSHFYMLDRVDIVRGAQGTLYGANSEGGIVRLYSKDPMHYEGTDVNAGMGNNFTRHVELAHFHRPSKKLAFSVAGFYNGQNGFFNNQNLNKKADKMNEAGAKVRLMWKPSSQLTFDLTSDYQFTMQNGFPYGNYNVADEWADMPSTTFLPSYRRNMVNTGLGVSYNMGSMLLSSNTSYQFLNDKMLMDIDYKAVDNMKLVQRQKMQAATEELTLRSTTDGFWKHSTGLFVSRQWLRTRANVTFGQGILGPIANAIETAMKNAIQNGIKNSFLEQMKQGIIQNMLNGGLSQAAAEAAAETAIASETSQEAALLAAQSAVDAMGVTMSAEMAVPNTFHQPITNMAVYHESNFSITPSLVATLGLRFDHTKAEVDYDSYGFMALTGGTANAIATYTLSSHILNNHSTTFNQLLPKFGLTYTIDSNNSNIYAAVSKGYMAGGYNIQLFSDILQADLNDPVAQQQAQRGDVEIDHTAQDYADIENAITYEPEESWNYEAGVHLNLYDNRLHLDATTFYTQLRNQQLSVMAPNYGFGRMTVNAGKSSTCGLELALRGQAVDNHLSWGATYSFTRATFREYKDTQADGTVIDYKDNKIPYVPAHAFSAIADYRFDVKGNAMLRSITLGANVTGQGKTYWDDANTASQGFYALLGAHALMDLGSLTVDIWARNITNTKYCTFAMPFSGAYIGQRGLPLQYGINLKLHL